MLTSIIILACGQVPLTRACLASIRRHTPQRHEVILIDNGSNAKDAKALARLGADRLIRNRHNRGFAAGANQGLQVARGDYVLLLNNDTVVVDGWLARLIAAAESDPSIGMVGPRTNRISGVQCTGDHYGTPFGRELYSRLVARTGAGQLRDTHRLVGFCLLVKRAVIERIGLLDERYQRGNYEDDDWCLRARLAGYRLVIAMDSFIHHEGSATFRANGGFGNSLEVNRARFVAKWGDRAASYVSGGGVAALYCAYDDDTWLAVSLESIYENVDAIYVLIAERPWAGEIGDTSTTLATLEAFPDPAGKLKVVRGDWRGASAVESETTQRNAGLDLIWQAGYGYALIIDADEVYHPDELRAMLQFAQQYPDVEAWQVGLFTYWKSPRYRIDPPEPLRPPMLLRRGRHFVRIRQPDAQVCANIPDAMGRLHHLSYARSDEACLRKITHFSHSTEIVPNWYEEKWLGWNENPFLEDLHPTHPAAYKRTIAVPPEALPPALRRLSAGVEYA